MPSAVRNTFRSALEPLARSDAAEEKANVKKARPEKSSGFSRTGLS